jgi:hypothetical protein
MKMIMVQDPSDTKSAVFVYRHPVKHRVAYSALNIAEVQRALQHKPLLQAILSLDLDQVSLHGQVSHGLKRGYFDRGLPGSLIERANQVFINTDSTDSAITRQLTSRIGLTNRDEIGQEV